MTLKNAQLSKRRKKRSLPQGENYWEIWMYCNCGLLVEFLNGTKPEIVDRKVKMNHIHQILPL